MQLVPLKCYSLATTVCEITSQKETILIPFNSSMVQFCTYLKYDMSITHPVFQNDMPNHTFAKNRLPPIIKMESCINLTFYIVPLHITIAFTWYNSRQTRRFYLHSLLSIYKETQAYEIMLCPCTTLKNFIDSDENW